MAVTIDVGNPDNLHPADKEPRLVRYGWANSPTVNICSDRPSDTLAGQKQNQGV